MDRLTLNYKGFNLYKAGLPNFSGNFSRDSILSAILIKDAGMLRNQLLFCAFRQGNKKDPHTGEEPGKIFHEYPGIVSSGLSTEFNACDTTALFLIGHEIYRSLSNDNAFTIAHKQHIERAAQYILSHIDDDLFIEDPKFCGAERFALKVTYWKDSVMLDRKDGEPLYPVVYTLAHIQNMRGLKSAAQLLNSTSMKKMAERMRKRIETLYDGNLNTFYIAIDKQGPVSGVSSDALHALFYLEPEEVSKDRLKKVIESAAVLETSIGYRTLCKRSADRVENLYHAGTVWPFEQACIHQGAKRFGFDHVAEVSSRILKVLDTEPEMFTIDDAAVQKGGCDPQLWTIAAKRYFGTVLRSFYRPGCN